MLSFLKSTKVSDAIVTASDIEKSYRMRPSFVNRLPWKDYSTKHKCFLLEDNESLGVCFQITPISCEARPDQMLEEISKSISEAIKNAIPCEKDNPWTLQVYVKKDNNLESAYKEIVNYFPEKTKNNPLTQDFLCSLKEHFEYITQSGGIFHDSQVTNLAFRGGVMHVYAVLYRRIRVKQKKMNNRRSHLEEIVRVSRKFSDQLRACGMGIRRMNGDTFYHWMSGWFNPEKQLQASLPRDEKKPIGFDLAEQLFNSIPESFEEGWLFDRQPHKLLTIQSMVTNPEIGHLSAERKRNVDDKVFNLIDHLPEDSIFVLNIVIQAPSEAELHLKTILHSAVGSHAKAVKVQQEVAFAEKSLANGDYLFPVVMGIYIKGKSIDELHEKEAQAEVLLNNNGFKLITDDELFPIDAYLRYLPMNYDYLFDKKNAHRSRYLLLSDIAKLLPFYGRSRGTGHPGAIFFNRGGEPWTYDAMVDKSKNAHMLLLGETGTGKSNLLNFLIALDLALYQSKFFIIEAGGSFELLGDYCQSLGLSVNKINIDLNHPVSLNPFADGLRVIDQLEAFGTDKREEYLAESCDRLLEEQSKNDKQGSSEEDVSRDILGDMVLAALIMITGGEKKEEEAIRRSDRMLIMDAIIDAAYFVKEQKKEQMIASDIVNAFDRIASSLDTREVNKIKRVREMQDAMRYFTKDPVSSRFFNTYGNPWASADLTIINFGLFANEGYEAHRSIAFAGVMNRILSLAEANQRSDRAIKVVADENHLFTSISLLADIETRITKMGRKLGLWLWLATQNMKDFADGARRMLSQIETWMCLALPPDEIEQIERFKTLSDEERMLFLSARKEKGKYTEGVLLSPKIKGLFRNVPPRLYLAMVATDQDEKNHRANIMKEYQCSEVEAVKIIARQMMKNSHSEHLDD